MKYKSLQLITFHLIINKYKTVHVIPKHIESQNIHNQCIRNQSLPEIHHFPATFLFYLLFVFDRLNISNIITAETKKERRKKSIFHWVFSYAQVILTIFILLFFLIMV